MWCHVVSRGPNAQFLDLSASTAVGDLGVVTEHADKDMSLVVAETVIKVRER